MKLLLPILLALSLCTNVVAQGEALNASILKAFSEGDAKGLSNHFSENIAIELRGLEKVYAKNQATQVLQTFFNRTQPKSFELRHDGRSAKMGAKFNIGMLRTSQGAFRVTYLLKPDEKNITIRKIKIVKVVQ